MTLTTRTTTRKAPWAAVLTALLAIVALVFGAMALAGPANAKDDNPNKPDNPGNSQNAPGHQDDGTPGNSDGTPGGGNENNNPNSNGPGKVWICHADTNNGQGQPNLGQGGQGGENKTGFNILYISVNAWENGHMGRHPNDRAFNSEADAIAYCGTVTPPKYYCPDDTAKKGTEMGHAYSATNPDDVTFCSIPTTPTCPDGSALPANGICSTVTTTYTCPATTAKSGTVMTHAYNPTVPEDVAFCAMTADQAAAIDAALAATVPEDVAPVLPAKVAVPAKVAPAPATVPAGDGSSVPQAPVALLALLALATAGAVASGLRLAMNR